MFIERDSWGLDLFIIIIQIKLKVLSCICIISLFNKLYTNI